MKFIEAFLNDTIDKYETNEARNDALERIARARQEPQQVENAEDSDGMSAPSVDSDSDDPSSTVKKMKNLTGQSKIDDEAYIEAEAKKRMTFIDWCRLHAAEKKIFLPAEPDLDEDVTLIRFRHPYSGSIFERWFRKTDQV